MNYYPDPLIRLISELKKLPSIGPKSAQRLALHLMKSTQEDIKLLTDAIFQLKVALRYCSICGSITDRDPCAICEDPNRDHSIICVVEEPDDVIALERAQFKGVYHVLMGALSPLDGVNPENLRIKELLERVNSQNISEIIFATNPTTEGQATAMYLFRRLKPLGLNITRIAYGLPVGGELEYADEVTLSKAMEGRREIKER
jgi:recombination protein RecR